MPYTIWADMRKHILSHTHTRLEMKESMQCVCFLIVAMVDPNTPKHINFNRQIECVTVTKRWTIHTGDEFEYLKYEWSERWRVASFNLSDIAGNLRTLAYLIDCSNFDKIKHITTFNFANSFSRCACDLLISEFFRTRVPLISSMNEEKNHVETLK